MELSTAQIIELLDDLSPADDAPERLNLNKAHILKTLLETDIELQGMMPWSSNYTFLISLAGSDKTEIVMAKESGSGVPGQGEVITIEGPLAIYKPCRGERPLWDFPDGKLCYREFAAYLISETLGWPLIPPTVLRRDAPHGPGTIQFYIQNDYDAHYFNLRENRAFDDTFRQIAVFDFIIN
ncbi:MAG: hypothetical protein R3264_07235, partial [Anaerolineae bacterium]|nr:hypothetical protein [Anaerolineae bacterium]